MMEYYPALERNELSSHVQTWKKNACYQVKEASLKRLHTMYIFRFQPSDPGKGKTVETVKKWMVTRGWREEVIIGIVQEEF